MAGENSRAAATAAAAEGLELPLLLNNTKRESWQSHITSLFESLQGAGAGAAGGGLGDDLSPGAHEGDTQLLSLSQLRNLIRAHGLHDLFQRYRSRHQLAYFRVYLSLQILFNFAEILIGLVVVPSDGHESLGNLFQALLIPTVLVSLSCAILIWLTFDEKIFKALPWTLYILPLTLLLILVGADLSHYAAAVHSGGGDRKSSAFPALIIIYFYLPFPGQREWPVSVMAGVSVTATYLIVQRLNLENRQALGSNWLFVGDVIYYFCGNLIGIYWQLMTDYPMRAAFLCQRQLLQSTILKRCEKEREEHLLSTILPAHITQQVKQELVEAIEQIEESKQLHPTLAQHESGGDSNNNPAGKHGKSPSKTPSARRLSRNQHGVVHKKPFSNLFVQHHSNVTILFADIVNFTSLTERLRPEELIETLNALFERFDKAAKVNNCTRIKLLGDCYFCVSGLPDPLPNHARNCVELGFAMIEIIQELSVKVNVDLAMRIGIHTGSVLSGVIGLYKWHFDIWSKDTLIANRMEQAGKAGLIHISKDTKEAILDASYQFSPGPGLGKERDGDEYLAKYDLETYMVRRRKTRNRRTERAVIWSNEDIQGVEREQRGSFSRRPTDPSGDYLLLFQKMWSQVDEQMEQAIDEMTLRLSYFSRKASKESSSNLGTNHDDLFTSQMIASTCVLICTGLIHWIAVLSLPRMEPAIWLWVIGTACTSLFTFLLALSSYCSSSCQAARADSASSLTIAVPESSSSTTLRVRAAAGFLHWLTNAINFNITNSLPTRSVIYVWFALLLALLPIIDLASFTEAAENSGRGLPGRLWYITYICSLAFVGCSSFLRLHFILKLFTGLVLIGAYSFILVQLELESIDKLSQINYLLQILVFLHFMDLQTSTIISSDEERKLQLRVQHEEVAKTNTINGILLYNILPMEIAQMYMIPNRIEAYSRHYPDVSIMFASIPNFMNLFTSASTAPAAAAVDELNGHHTGNGINCLQILNEIIVEFDQALLKFDDVEKIKMIGSTYMAAAGLGVRGGGVREGQSASTPRRPSTDAKNYAVGERRRSSKGQGSSSKSDPTVRQTTLLALVEFATTMNSLLERVNQDCFMNFQLRVGLDCGPIVAGVIGTSKPLYDIWGDCVNMASRMESTGVAGKIQVGKNCMELLTETGCVQQAEFRGNTLIKGKSQTIPTYFVTIVPQKSY